MNTTSHLLLLLEVHGEGVAAGVVDIVVVVVVVIVVVTGGDGGVVTDGVLRSPHVYSQAITDLNNVLITQEHPREHILLSTDDDDDDDDDDDS